MNFQEKINKVILPSLVVKADLFDEKLERYGIYPNAEDSFIVTNGFVSRSVSRISELEERAISLGSKMIGSYRDKGSVTGIVQGDYRLLCDFQLENLDEVNNFVNFLDELNKPCFIDKKNFIVTFEPDVVAGSSVLRDNVNALLIDGLTELDCIIENKEITMTCEELSSVKVENLAEIRKRDHRIYIVNKNSRVVVEELGEHLVIFENYFWQPMHDNSEYIKAKKINCLYHQAVDGFQVYAPSLYKAIMNSSDKESILEDMLCLGMKFKYNSKSELIKPEDLALNILDNLIID